MLILRRYGSLALLGFTPAAVAVAYFAPERSNAIFFLSVVAILPLAGYIGHATEQLALKLGGGIGGLLNATFGNAAELIIGGFALHKGLPDLVKASITGSIIGNVLLVFGASALVGGLRFSVQRFNRTAAGLGTTMLLLSAIGLGVPAVFHRLARAAVPPAPDLKLDTEIAVVLFLTYLLSLVFTLRTHRNLYGGVGDPHPGEDGAPQDGARDGARDGALAGAHHGAHGAVHGGAHDGAPGGESDAAAAGSTRGAVITLLAATAGVAVVSEVLVEAVSEAAQSLGMSQLFVGVVIVALVGNAAEHYSALVLAARNQMDAAIGIAVGSSTQIALFVAPVLVFLSYAVGPAPMDLIFTTFELVAIAISVVTIAFIAHDGETHWMEGVQLLAVYVILCLGFYFLPAV